MHETYLLAGADLRRTPSHSAMNVSWIKASVIKHAFGHTLHRGLTPAATLASWAGVVTDRCADGGFLLLLHVLLVLLLSLLHGNVVDFFCCKPSMTVA